MSPFLTVEEGIFVRKHFYARYNISTRSQSNQITFNKREKTRIIVNSDELVNTLNTIEGYQVEVVTTGNIPFINQVETMSKTRIYISNHGAQNVNIIFLPPQTPVIEIFNPLFFKNCYQNIAIKASLHYYKVQTEGIVIADYDVCKLTNTGGHNDYVWCNVIVNTTYIREKICSIIDKEKISK